MTTLNTIIEEENTLDTEGEKEELVRKAERDIEFVVSNPDMYDISVQVKNIVRNLLSSRDTYWKERVVDSKRFFIAVEEDNITIRPVVRSDLDQILDNLK